MIYFSPEIIGCRVILTRRKERVTADDGSSSLEWIDYDPFVNAGTVIGYLKKDHSGDSGSFCLMCIGDNGAIVHYYMGYAEEEHQMSIHPDDFPYFIKKIQDRFRRGVSLAKNEEIDRPQLLDLGD